MIKGHVQIELHNHNSGFKERIEGDNMITDALKYVIPNYIGAGRDAGSYVMPLCKKALGGIMLFDGRLTEDTSNIFFPSEAHLVGWAGQNTNTDEFNRGSLNGSETIETDTGFQTVWDFNTAQANGTIHSLGLTLAERGGFSDPFVGYALDSMHQAIRKSDGSTSNQLQPLCYDMKTQTLYYIGLSEGHSTSSRSEYDSENRKYIYYYTTNCTIYKEYIPTGLYGLADVANRAKYPEEVTSFSIEKEGDSTDIGYYFLNGYDGYAYLVWETSNSSGDGKFRFWKLKLSDYSFELSEVKEVSIKSCHLSNRWEVVSKGYAYLRSYDLKSIYIVNMSNPVDILQASLPEGYVFETSNLVVLKNGGVRFTCHKLVEGTTNNYQYFIGICYPDSKIIISPRWYTATNYSTQFRGYESYDLVTDGLMIYGSDYSSYRGYGYQVNNYLGSIFNLASPIVKTAASSMKVVYTLTNVDE